MGEEELIHSAIKGDHKAFSALIKPYMKQAHQTAFLLLHDYSFAEDAVQKARELLKNTLQKNDVNSAVRGEWLWNES